MELDIYAGNNKWYYVEHTKLKLIYDYQTFIEKGEGYKPSVDCTKIRVLFVYAIKHKGTYRPMLVAGGHLTAIPSDCIYMGVFL